VPLSWFPLRLRVINEVIAPREVGIGPVKPTSLNIKVSSIIFVKYPISLGIEPVKKLPPRFNFVSDVIVPIEEGSVPMIVLSAITNSFMFFNSPISEGSVPSNNSLTSILKTLP
jgi:hypothetical protein